MEQNYFEKVHRNKITSERDVQATLVFNISKTYQKEISKQPPLFDIQKHMKISTPLLHQFFIEIA